MAADFPSNPTVGQIYNFGGAYYTCNGTGWVTGGVVANQTPHGQCRLGLEGANLVLRPYNGNKLIINNKVEIVPDGGVSLPPTGLTAGGLYYIYAYMDAGVMKLLPGGGVAPVRDPLTGVYVSNAASPTASIVGMAMPAVGPVFSDTLNARYVRSWFNDPGIQASGRIPALRTAVGNNTWQVFDAYAYFLSWAGEIVDATLDGTIYSTTAGHYGWIGPLWDGATALYAEDHSVLASSAAANAFAAVSCRVTRSNLGEGGHYLTCGIFVPTGMTMLGYWTGAPQLGAIMTSVVTRGRP